MIISDTQFATMYIFSVPALSRCTGSGCIKKMEDEDVHIGPDGKEYCGEHVVDAWIDYRNGQLAKKPFVLPQGIHRRHSHNGPLFADVEETQ